jgi:solute carrier family 35 (adenosine 3'-phospho 5'-phosphosulfate transporter), member B3
MSFGQAFRDVTASFETYNTTIQFIILVSGVFLFFGIHNYLQEAIMHVESFGKHGVMLGYFEVFGVTVCSYIERTFIVKERGMKAPISSYPLLTLCLMASSALSNISLNYINFPTKVVFRSSKLIPTMIIASIIHRQVFTILEYLCAVAACTGLVMFAAADWDLSPSFHPIGILLISASVCADAVLPNAQEKLFKQGSSRLEVTFYTNIFVLAIMTITTFLSNDLIPSLQQIYISHQLKLYFMIYTFIAYVAISFHMNIVKRFGGVAAVLVATGRKAMTLILSFVLFPKGFSWFYPVGAVLVLGGLTVSSLAKRFTKTNNNNNNHNNAISSNNGSHSNGLTHHYHPHHEEIAALKSHNSDLEFSDRGSPSKS